MAGAERVYVVWLDHAGVKAIYIVHWILYSCKGQLQNNSWLVPVN